MVGAATLARVLAGLGRVDEARALVEEQTQEVAESQDLILRWEVLTAAAEVRAAAGQRAEAAEALERASKRASERAMR